MLLLIKIKMDIFYGQERNEVDEMAKKNKDKVRTRMATKHIRVIQPKQRTFNGRTYNTKQNIYKTKKEAEDSAKFERTFGYGAIVDKVKEGYFLWISDGKIR